MVTVLKVALEIVGKVVEEDMVAEDIGAVLRVVEEDMVKEEKGAVVNAEDMEGSVQDMEVLQEESLAVEEKAVLVVPDGAMADSEEIAEDSYKQGYLFE